MPAQLQDRVVVITGASSGIGRATALECARQGASVVVSARRGAALETLVVTQCEESGGRALAIPADVTDPAALDYLARETVDRFGRIDVWFNNAGVYQAGKFDDVPADDFRQVVETNLFGTVNGTRAVLPYFQAQERGTLINIGSVLSKFGASHFSAYCTSKFAVAGLTESIRQELRGTGINVCLILPAAIDTPLFSQSANFSGRQLKPIDPVYPAKQVARSVVSLIKRPRLEIYIGRAGQAAVAGLRLTPYLLSDRVIGRVWEKNHFMPHPANSTSGNLFEPVPNLNTDVSGGWSQTGSSGNGKLVVAGLAATAIPAAMLWRRSAKSSQRHRNELSRLMSSASNRSGDSMKRLRDFASSNLERVKFWS